MWGFGGVGSCRRRQDTANTQLSVHSQVSRAEITRETQQDLATTQKGEEYGKLRSWRTHQSPELRAETQPQGHVAGSCGFITADYAAVTAGSEVCTKAKRQQQKLAFVGHTQASFIL